MNLRLATSSHEASETSTTSGQSRALSFTYDTDGNGKTMTWPDGQVTTYAFDNADQFSSVGNAAASVGYGDDGLGRLTSVSRPSGAITSAIGYDAANRITSLAHAFAVTSGNQSWTFAYSPASQMTAAAGSNTVWDWAGAPSATVNNTADGLNRDAVIAAASGHDGNGNLIFDGTRHFTYDGENRLLTESGPIAMALTYDPMGRLAQGTINGATTQFL